MNENRISPKQLSAAGWQWAPDPVTIGTWKARTYQHRNGWTLTHCGHPTALWPYTLCAPDGRMILTGVRGSGDPLHGTAWPTVAAAVAWVLTDDARRYE